MCAPGLQRTLILFYVHKGPKCRDEHGRKIQVHLTRLIYPASASFSKRCYI